MQTIRCESSAGRMSELLDIDTGSVYANVCRNILSLQTQICYAVTVFCYECRVP